MKTIDLNKFYREYEIHPEMAKLALVQMAERTLLEAVLEHNVTREDLAEDMNYAEVLSDWLGWPDWQDGGIFEQCVDIAANTVLQVMGFKPYHNVE